MGIQMKNICPDCFSLSFHNGICDKCGFNESDNSMFDSALGLHSVLRGRYIIGKVLGRGGFGITYKAYDLERQEICAVKEYCPKFLNLHRASDNSIKVINGQEKGKYEHGKLRFEEEAQILFRISKYPYIVKIRDSFHENNTYYYIMDFVDGINIKRVITGGGYKYSVKEATEVMLKIGNTLQSIYNQEGLIHRDISPENILIDRTGEYTLIDFGSAKEIVEGRAQEFSVVLKPGFAPLEQYSETMPQGSYTDVYALAGTYYFMLSGKMIPDAITRMNNPKEYVPLDILGISIETEISQVINRALEISYKQRTQTIKQFLDELVDATQTAQEPVVSSGVRMYDSEKTVEVSRKASCGYLEIISGKSIGKQWKIPDNGKTQIIGRDSNRCHIVISYDEVSRTHLEIQYNSKTKEFEGRDFSTNGIYVDNEFVSGAKFKVKPGCIMQFPETECVLYLGVQNE